MKNLSDCIQNECGNYTGTIWTKDVKEFIRLLKKTATKRVELDFDKKPGKEFVYCGGCGRFVIEEGCTCGMVTIEDIDKLVGKKLI